jgi:deoxyribonuclease-4
MYVGYTPGKEKNFYNTIKKANSIGATAIQVWTGSPYSNNYSKIECTDAANTKTYIRENTIHLISHSPYVINFARENQIASQKRLIADLENIESLGGSGTVLHTGKNVKTIGQSYKQAEENFTENIRKVLENYSGSSNILLENMCGCGSSMWCELSPWVNYWNEYPYKDRTRWCIDTAHLYAAGEYDISKKSESLRFYNDFSDHIGWQYVDCIHFNGSLVGFGAKNDRHADIDFINSGCIKTKGLRQFARIAFMNNTPLILETPGEISMKQQIDLIKSWNVKNIL